MRMFTGLFVFELFGDESDVFVLEQIDLIAEAFQDALVVSLEGTKE